MMTDKVLCPWCGAEMKRDWRQTDYGEPSREVWFACENCKSNSPIAWGENYDEALKTATEYALRRYTPPLKPMTLEEVWKEDDPMWVEGKNGALYIGDFYASMSAKNGWDVQTLGSAKPRLLLEDYYGRTWRCWERKPTDEERSAAEWES